MSPLTPPGSQCCHWTFTVTPDLLGKKNRKIQIKKRLNNSTKMTYHAARFSATADLLVILHAALNATRTSHDKAVRPSVCQKRGL